MPAAGLARVARCVSDWTTYLLAAGILLALGLAIGWQALAWWREGSAHATTPVAEFSLPDVAVGREFWTRRGPLKVERVRGDADAAAQAMRAFCRSVEPTPSTGDAGPGEQKFVASLLAQPPLEESNGLALYQPPGQLAMVVAVARAEHRIVGWSFALPAGEEEWSLYHFRPLAGGPRIEPASSIAGASR